LLCPNVKKFKAREGSDLLVEYMAYT